MSESEPPPDVSWMRERDITDGPPVFALLAFAWCLLMGVLTIALLLS